MVNIKYLAVSRRMRLEVGCNDSLPAIEIRLGELKKPAPDFAVLLDGKNVASKVKQNGDSFWVLVDVPAGKRNFVLEVR